MILGLVLGPDTRHRLDRLGQEREACAWFDAVVSKFIGVPAGSTPRMSRPAERRSSVATAFAVRMTSRWVTMHAAVPMRRRSVTAAASARASFEVPVPKGCSR